MTVDEMIDDKNLIFRSQLKPVSSLTFPASHYYEGSLGLTLMVADPSDRSRFYLLHFDRGRIDVLRDIPAFLARGFRWRTSRLLTRRLEEIKQDAISRF